MRTSRVVVAMLLYVAAVDVAAAGAAAAAPLRELAEYPLHSASATALSLNDATLSAQLQAKVERVLVRVSQQVSKGELLLVLDCADYQLNLQLAQARVRAADARLSLANSQRERTQQLFERQLASQDTADTTAAEAIARAAERDEARIGLQQAQLAVARCQIKAPFDGIVTGRAIAEGQLAAVGSPLLSLVETERLELSAQVYPADIALLRNSRELYFDYGGSRFPVVVTQLGGVIDPVSRNQEVRFEFADRKPPPGSAGKLMWRDPRPFVPAQYMVMREQQYGVLVARGGVVEFVAMEDSTPGRAAPTQLPLDTLIMTRGLGTLKTGDKSGDALSSP